MPLDHQSWGEIEDGSSVDHAVLKEHLTIFRRAVPIGDESDPEEWRGEA
jgi:hypothetical protein